MSILVAGIDAGFVHTGWALVKLYGPADRPGRPGQPAGRMDELISVGVIRPKDDGLVPASFHPAPDYAVTLGDKVVYSDAGLCVRLVDNLCDVLWGARAAFIELPSGGSQGARAGRCMGMSTAVVVTTMRLFGRVHDSTRAPVLFEGHEIYAPDDVEKALGIHLTPGEAKAMKKGDKTKWKKERIREAVVRAFPAFDDWPPVKNDTQDAYDAVAAFLCARKRNLLYGELVRRIEER